MHLVHISCWSWRLKQESREAELVGSLWAGLQLKITQIVSNLFSVGTWWCKIALNRNIDVRVTILLGGSAAAGETSLHILVPPQILCESKYYH